MENLNFKNFSPENHEDTLNKNRNLRIAVVGCLHGNLKDTYDAIQANEMQTGNKVDILLCCGDFQCIRNKQDLKYKSCPEKYKQLGQFHHYYLTSTSAPILTIFIGGNHEASNVLDENFYSGWICENIFYLGRAGVINYKGIRIAGLSGIFKKFDYHKGHFETDIEKDIKSIFHVREFEIAKISNIKSKIDILMTHDWPTGCVNRKDINKITKIKYHWKDELVTDTLGSPASGFLLKLLKPNLFLSGHMHYTYFNDIYHDDGSVTHFIALDKAGTKKNRYYLHVFDYHIDEKVPEEDFNDPNIYLDSEWAHISKMFNEYIPLTRSNYDFSKFIENREEYLRCMNRYEEIFNQRNNFTNYNTWRTIDVIPNKEFYEKINFYYFLNLENKDIYKESQQQEKQEEENKFNFINIQKKYIMKYDPCNLDKQRENIVKMLSIEDYHLTKNKNMIHKDLKDLDKQTFYSNITTNINKNLTSEQTAQVITNNQSNNEEINIDLDFV
jgi:lariat debranching enzyme